MREPARWGPDPQAPGLLVFRLHAAAHPRADIVAATAALARGLGVPVQAVRGDRVLSWAHLVMAAQHAQRARRARRSRATDPGIEFLLYLAGERQITPAIAAFGVPPEVDGGEGPPILIVLLGVSPAGSASDAAARCGLHIDPARPGSFRSPEAFDWWRTRLVPPPADRDEAEARLLGRMARLAVTKA